MLNPLEGRDRSGQRSELAGMTAEQDHLEARVVRDVHVRGRYDGPVVVMLNLSEAGGEVALVVVIDERQDAERVGEVVPHLLIHQAGADEVAERLGPVRVAVFLQEPVKPPDQGAVDGDAESGKGRHSVTRIYKKVTPPEAKINCP